MDHLYHINVFWSQDDGCWIADVPDLRPCSGHGDNPADAVSAVEDAITLWLEVTRERGHPVPAPRYRAATDAA